MRAAAARTETRTVSVCFETPPLELDVDAVATSMSLSGDPHQVRATRRAIACIRVRSVAHPNQRHPIADRLIFSAVETNASDRPANNPGIATP
jgi:hypothetical protein